MIDHLFRHQYGKMVSILTRLFGLSNLELIEDAVQDTFIRAVHTWKDKIPENPEAWLTQAAKNRIIDLFRKLKADTTRIANIEQGPSAIALNDLFLEHEIEDAELRMIFTACHPELNPKDQIAFALRTISGFSSREIASSLLLKEETIKKRLTRARQSFQSKNIQFSVPMGAALPPRTDSVLSVIYLIFNEGFHSIRTDILIRKDLCGEALRLCQMLLKREDLRNNKVYALFALMCFHSARIESKTTVEGDIIDLEHQDRSLWHQPLIDLGKNALIRAFDEQEESSYRYEAAIALEHVSAKQFKDTDWKRILMWYDRLIAIHPNDFTQLNRAIVLMQMQSYAQAKKVLDAIEPDRLEQRSYLFYGAMTEYYLKTGKKKEAQLQIEMTLKRISNEAERAYFLKRVGGR